MTVIGRFVDTFGVASVQCNVLTKLKTLNESDVIAIDRFESISGASRCSNKLIQIM